MESPRTPLLPAGVTVGTIVAGKYRIDRVLGSGGMGVVVAANHVGLRQAVAIKFLLPKAGAEPVLSTRLLREARAAAALKGAHVARVFDVDVLADGSPYIVMEYLEGQTLASLIEGGGALPAAGAVDWALEVCEALAEAHSLGIVHRDLKPANLFLAESPGGRQMLRVLDFGISKAIDGDRTESTHTDTDSHALVGSPPYVSPEQLVNPREVEARTDIWSLGVVLYECLAGSRPFRGETVARLWDAILREPAPALGTPSRPIPPGLERVVLRCLEKKPQARYADVQELARALAPFGTAKARASLELVEGLAVPTAKRTSERTAPVKPADETLAESDSPRTEEPMTRSSAGVTSRRSQERWVLPAIVLLALGVIGTYVLRRGGSPIPTVTPSSAALEPPNAVPPIAPSPSATFVASPLGSTQSPAAGPNAAPEPVSKPGAPAPRAVGPRTPPVHGKAKVPATAEVAASAAEQIAEPSPAAPTPQRKPENNDEAVYSDRE